VASKSSRLTGAAIELAIAEEKWGKARRLVERALKIEPESHWLLTRLALTYYEEFDYQRALGYSEQALVLAPDCWLVQWDYAGALDMLDRSQEAIAMYERILRRGIDLLANDACGEGRARARGLRADALYRVARCYKSLGNRKKAVAFVNQSLSERGPGCASIYPISELRRFAADVSSVAN
jgi:tetratricopeptide (TPR) repeat protein